MFLVKIGGTWIQLWLFCCVTIICNFVCMKQQNRLSLILAQRMSKYQKIIDNREPRTIFKVLPIWDCRIELLQRSVARLRPLSLGQNAVSARNLKLIFFLEKLLVSFNCAPLMSSIVRLLVNSQNKTETENFWKTKKYRKPKPTKTDTDTALALWIES